MPLSTPLLSSVSHAKGYDNANGNAMAFRFNPYFFAKLEARLRKDLLQDLLDHIGPILIERIRSKAPVLSGRLRDSYVFSSIRLSATTGRIRVLSLLPYARITEKGGWIYPKARTLLSWVGPDGKRRFARKVYHPAQPHVGPAVEELRHELPSLVRAFLAGYK